MTVAKEEKYDIVVSPRSDRDVLIVRLECGGVPAEENRDEFDVARRWREIGSKRVFSAHVHAPQVLRLSVSSAFRV